VKGQLGIIILDSKQGEKVGVKAVRAHHTRRALVNKSLTCRHGPSKSRQADVVSSRGQGNVSNFA